MISEPTTPASAAHESDTITVTLVPERSRLTFLPRMFGQRLMMRGENAVYDWMRRLCGEYSGGFWDYFTLSNGGFYMRPQGEGPMTLSHGDNYFDGTVSRDAAGIIASLFALSHLAAATESEHLIEMYDALRAFAGAHPEASVIARAID